MGLFGKSPILHPLRNRGVIKMTGVYDVPRHIYASHEAGHAVVSIRENVSQRGMSLLVNPAR